MFAKHSSRLRMLMVATAATLAMALAPLAARATEAFPDPFEDARYVPSTVTQYFCFVEAGESLSELMQTSLAPGLKVFYDTCRSGQSWRDLAASTGIEPAKLFDMLVSKRVTLVTDQDIEDHARPGEAPDFSRWVLMARVDDSFAKDLLKLLGGRVREFVDDTPLYAAESGSLRFAYRDGRFYLAAANGEALLHSMLARSIPSALTDDDEFREARRVGPGDFGMFKRGTGDLRWQAGSAKVRRDHLNLNFISRHEPHGAAADSGDAINLGLLRALSENAVYVGVERTPRVDDPPSECSSGPTLMPLVPIARAEPLLLSHLGPTMFTVIELPDASDPDRRGIPTMTVGIEMRDPREAVGELDAFMNEATSKLASHRRDQAALVEPAPEVVNAGSPPQQLRTAEWHGCGMPMKMLGIDQTWPQRVVWSSVQSDDRAWWVASTDEQSQRRIAGKLESYISQCGKASTTRARGALFGPRLAELLAQWPAVQSGASNPFLAELFAWRELMTSVSNIGWRVSEPGPETTETYISVSWKGDRCETRE